MKAFDEVVKRVALSENVYFVDASNRIPRDLQHFKDDCHLTETGSELLAQIIAGEIISSKIIDKKSVE